MRWLVPVLAVVALAVGVVGWWRYADLSRGAGTDNAALVDSRTTSAVQSQVARALEQVLTYDHADPATTKTAADRLLSGKARTEYDTLFAALEKQAPGQKLVLSATVSAAGVERLEGDTARLLVYVDQSSRRAGEDQTSVSAAQLSVTRAPLRLRLDHHLPHPALSSSRGLDPDRPRTGSPWAL